MTSLKARLVAASVFVLSALVPLATGIDVAWAQKSEIRYIVNNLPVTSYDIARRAAFLRLQRRGGNLNKIAEDEMVDQALKMVEMKRLRINVSKAQVDQAFANFARSNRLTTSQLTQILGQAGVTAAHFKDYVMVQIGWNQALGARFRAEGPVGEQDAVRRMLEQGGTKPTATEYMLQQVIFVVPASERGKIMGQRKREAEAMRARFSGCNDTQDFAKGLIDVTVRSLGRVLEPELPPEWAPLIKKTKIGGATGIRETERGVEFIGICNAREVSDDRVAQLTFSNEGSTDEKAKELDEKYLKELREHARIIKR